MPFCGSFLYDLLFSPTLFLMTFRTRLPDTFHHLVPNDHFQCQTPLKNAKFVIPVLRYGSECWCMRKRDERKLVAAEMGWLRRIIGMKRRDRLRNEVIRERLQQEETKLQKVIKKRRLKRFRHVTRIGDSRLSLRAKRYYTLNHKKRDILFLTITLANLNRFL